MKKRLLAAIMSLCMIVSLLPVSALAYGGHGGYPGGGETQDGEDAYFYVLQPNYIGTLAEADKGDFYYVGKGSVEDGDPAFDVEGIDELIVEVPTASEASFSGLGLDGDEVYNYVGQSFGNVTWYRTVWANGANGNRDDGNEVIYNGGNCWHVDGTVKPVSPLYEVQFIVGSDLIARYLIKEEQAIGQEDINEATTAADKKAPTGQHVEWYFDNKYTEEASDEQIIAKSAETAAGRTLYIFGQYKEDFVENKSVAVEKTVKLNGVPVTAGTEAEAGDTLTYTIKVANMGNVALTNIQIEDTFTGVGTPTGDNLTWINTGEENEKAATWTIGNLALNGEATITYTYTVDKDDAGSIIKNSVAAVDVKEDSKDDNNTEVTVKKPEKYTITVNYVDDSETPVTIKTAVELPDEYESGDSYNFVISDHPTSDFPETISYDGNNYIFDETATGNVLSGTIEGTDKTITLVYTKDNWDAETDNPTGGDGIPDKYQATVTYTVENGTWTSTNSDTITQVYTLKVWNDTTKAWDDVTPVPVLADVPDEATPSDSDKYLSTGTWSESVPVEGTTQVTESVTYTYTLTATKPSMTVTKSVDKTAVTVNDPITYTITVTNNGSSNLYNVTLTDPLWSAGTVLTITDGTESTATLTGNSYTIGTINVGRSVTISYTYTPTATGTVTNSVTVTADPTNDNDPTDQITEEAGSSDVTVGEVVTYTVTFDPNNEEDTWTETVEDGNSVAKPADPVWNDDYIFMGWTTETIPGRTYGVGASLPDMVFQNSTPFTPAGNTTLYAVWGEDRNHDDVADVYEVFIAPADITIYTGGTGYSGVTDEDGNVIDNYEGSGLPEPGFHIVLPADLDIREGSNLENVLTFHYSGEDSLTGTTVDHTWTLSYVGVYSMNPTRYVYSLSANSNGVPIRILYKDGAGNVQDDDQIDMSANAASAEYTMSINPGGLTPTAIQAEITKLDGSKVTRSLVIGTGELTIRSTVDDDTTPIAGNEDEVSGGSFTAVHTGASYKVNDSEVDVPTTGDRVHLLVDEVSDSPDFNNAMGEAALDHANMPNASYETAYLDLVDSQNGNTVVTLDNGSMDIYWPMPSNADPYGDFQVVHYVDMNREVSTTEDQLDNQRTELLDGTAERINGDWYVHFTTRSFSPFVLVYEEDTSRPVNPNPGGGSGSGDSDSDPTGNLSIELDVNGGDDEFTFTVILTDKDGDDLENNFYYNGDYTGTIGSGDEITLEGGDKIVIRNLPEGTRYEVIIETADGYTYVIDGEEGVIHTGMNEAEFTATRTVPVADPSVTGVSRWLNTTDHIAYLTGYPGGAFGPDNNMTRAEVAQMFYALLNNKNVTITKTFPDVPADAWYATAVNTLASLGMVSGDENGNYRPNDPITRAEFCVIALAFAYEPENAVCYFGDVSRSDWFYTYVAQAASYGWIGGYTNGNFGPNDRITRAQVTTIVNNMLGRAADRDYVIDHQADLVQFTDLTRAHWGYFQIMEATNAHDYTKSNGTENWR